MYRKIINILGSCNFDRDIKFNPKNLNYDIKILEKYFIIYRLLIIVIKVKLTYIRL